MDASQVFCLAQRVLLPRRPDSGKIPAKHPSALLLFSYSQITDRCFFIPSFRTSVHRLMESYQAWLQAALQLLTAVPIPYKQDFQVTFTANGYQAQGVPSIDKAQVYILY